MSLRARKVLRQKRLREVGEAGQAKIAAASLAVQGIDFRAEMAVRYLIGAGVGTLSVAPELLPLAQRLDAEATLAPLDPGAPRPALAVDDLAFMHDPAAKEAALGAREALHALVATLGLDPVKPGPL